jgi:diketogulonate reductase-like aldo/keto reductase
MSTNLKTVSVPIVGFGTYDAAKNSDLMASAVRNAIKAGYRHFDLAKLYDNEVEVGAAIRAAISEGDVRRDDLYICSKLWCTDNCPEEVYSACKGSLERTGLEYLDCYMMHWPVQWTKDSIWLPDDTGMTIMHQNDRAKLAASYAAMEELLEAGLTRSLGVSNFDITLLRNLLEDCRIAPRTNEVEMHPYLPQTALLNYCEDRGVTVVAYSPMGKVNSRPFSLSRLTITPYTSPAKQLNK